MIAAEDMTDLSADVLTNDRTVIPECQSHTSILALYPVLAARPTETPVEMTSRAGACQH